MDRKTFAEEVGVSRNSVAAYEASDTPPRMVVLIAWATKTGVPIEWLLRGEDPPRRVPSKQRVSAARFRNAGGRALHPPVARPPVPCRR